jgi:uncharacterized ion transporter superfamily protein YfcC
VKPRLRVPHVFVLLALVILVCSVATWIVPSGAYQREQRVIEGTTRNLVIPGTFEPVAKHYSVGAALLGDDVEGQATPVGLMGYLSAIPRGMEAAADIIFFIFVIGGVFGILQRTGVITASVGRLVDRLQHRGALLTVAVMAVFAVGGSTLGMGEEFIPLVPVFVLVARRLGYDALYGLAMVQVAAQVGFAASTTNPFTVIVAQGIAELPLHSGMGLRLVFLVCALTVAVIHLLRYGARVRRDRSLSLVADVPEAWQDIDAGEAARAGERFRREHVVILAAGAAIFAFVVYAVQHYHWWMAEMGGGFLLMGLVAAAAARLSVDTTARAFVQGCKEMTVAALVVGFARGIAVVLQDGLIIDTVVHAAAALLEQIPRYLAVVGMLGFESILNLFIPSGSGQAAVSMPLMAPLADIIGVSRQTAVFSFTCGDGFSNLIIPTSGILMAMLGLARVPYGRWLRFMLPLFGQLLLLSVVFLTVAVMTGYH